MRTALLIVAALVLAFASARVARHGPDYALYCGFGVVNGVEINCPKPRLNGGWPAPYLFDRPGISVEDRLHWGEDEFRPGPFLADVGFYALGLLVIARVGRVVRRRLTPSSPPSR